MPLSLIQKVIIFMMQGWSMMKLFITSTNTDIGKTYVTQNLFKRLTSEGYNVCIFKPFQTEMLPDGTYPDLEVYLNECQLTYQLTSLYTFKDPVSPHLAFKREPDQPFDINKVLNRLALLDRTFDFVLIEGAGGIAVPIYEYESHFYMTTDLIKDTADKVISVLPSQLGAISDAIVHHHYLKDMNLPPHILLMNQFTNTALEQDNHTTIEKFTNEPVFTFKKEGKPEDFSNTFIQQILGGQNHE